MAVTMNRLTSGSGTPPLSTASFTPAANSLVLAFIVVDDFHSGPNVTLSNGNGLTWVNLFDANIYIMQAGNSCGLWRAMATTPSTGTISITADSAIQWDIIEFSGVDTSGSNGSGAVVQISQFGGSPGTPTVTFSSPTNSSNAIVGFMGCHDGTVTVGPGSGFTTIDTSATANNIWISQWLNGVSQSICDFTQSAGSNRLFGLEVGAGSAPAPTVGSPTGLAIGAGF